MDRFLEPQRRALSTLGARWDAFAGKLAAGLMLLAGALLLYAPVPWLNDLSEWLFQADVLARKLLDRGAVDAYVVAPYPVPSALALAILTLLSSLLPLTWAAKLFVLSNLAGWWWLSGLWVRRQVPAGSLGSVRLLLCACFALSSFFWYGFINYQIGLLLLLLYLCTDAEQGPAWRQALWGLMLFASHAMLLPVWALLVGVRALRRAGQAEASAVERCRRLLSNAWPLLPAAGLSLWYLLGRFSSDFPAMYVQARMSGWLESALYKLGYPLMLGSFRNIMAEDGSAVFESLPALYWLGAICNAVVIGLLALWGIGVLWGALSSAPFSPRNSKPSADLMVVAWLLAALYVLIPYHLFGQVNGAGRLLLPLLALAMMIAPRQSFRWWRWAAAPAALGAALSLLGYALLVIRLPSDQLGHPMRISIARTPDSGTVFGFNAALNAGTRYRYFNYRVLLQSERVEQAAKGDYVGLYNTTSLLVDYRPDNSQR